MDNRDVQYPNRFKMVKVPGTDDIFEVSPAPGNVYTEGTFWNKGNVLKDATAALYGKGPAAVPDDIFAAIPSMIQASTAVAEGRARVETGSYIGTGYNGTPNTWETKTLNFTFDPKLIIISTPGFVTEASPVSSYNYLAVFLKPSSVAMSMNGGALYTSGYGNVVYQPLAVKWPANGVSWDYYVEQNGIVSLFGLNYTQFKYFYIAIG